MRIVFMGTPDFAAVSLQRLLDERFDVVACSRSRTSRKIAA